ncbi:hypothetical protein BD626DRAFT_548128 [Schizophyllum amplum]|uniref:Uncharacterized protein n=1 Tax=Schizophyllum amplum TaxID=97359 RepID=A0A550CED6_9AGAR|nr:hypothetical protein BD626DRAFT_548128 [Auriculariopsis ampla]
MDGPKFTKKRKITDKSIPNTVAQNPDFAEDSRMYTDLLEMERRLDWTMTRKKAEVQDALSRNVTTTRTLRIFLSHTVSDQPWQTGGIGPEGANFETGEGIPAWAFRIEGRLLESSTSRAKDKVMQRKFSTFIKRMVIELDRDPSSYPDGNIIEWPKAPGAHNPVMDGFTVRRTGDTPTNIRVVLYLDHQPEQFKVQEGLANIIGVRQDSRLGVIQAMWNYIKINQLQDKADRTMIHLDEPLKMLLQGRSDLAFAMIPAFVNKFLQPPDPILLRYTLDPGMFPPERPTAWDVEVKLEDTGMKGRMHTAVAPSKEHLAALVKLDEEISLHVQSLHNAHLKRTFLTSFAEDPAKFIQTWLESQSRDLENILGSGPSMGATLRTEELRRSEFFKLPWVQELGKLRQWAGEVIASREKTTVSDELQELELDIELRRNGAKRLAYAADGFHHFLAKKKVNEAIDSSEKLLPIDTLGEFESAYGDALTKLGRAHCKIATLQETFALQFEDTYVASLKSLLDDIREYDVQRKKLESRRLSYDAAHAKLEKLKTSKKEKERKEAEEELERAQFRFEEAEEDVRAHIHQIQESEASLLREVTAFLDSEIKYVKHWLEILEETREEWPETKSILSTPSNHTRTTSTSRSSHTRQASSLSRATSSALSRSASKRSEKPPSIDSSEEEDNTKSRSRATSLSHKRTESRGESRPPSRAPSRPGSSLGRKRADSNVTAGGKEDKEKDKDKDRSRKMSVSGWASSLGRSKKKLPDESDEKEPVMGRDERKKFSSLENLGKEDDTDAPSRGLPIVGRKHSNKSMKSMISKSPTASPKPPPPPRILKAPSQRGNKYARALYDFSGAADELSFHAGDEIAVVSEVLDEWWMGELAGRRGLFPTSYVEVIEAPSASHPRIAPQPSSPEASDFEDEDLNSRPMEHNDAGISSGPFFSVGASKRDSFAPSITSSVDGDEDRGLLRPRDSDFEDGGGLLAAAPAITRRLTTSDAGKRAPPPPPPPRRMTGSSSAIPPSSASSSSLALGLRPQQRCVWSEPECSGHDYDVSPFESAQDLDTVTPGKNGCTAFKQNPFKPQGFCNNCFQYHT